MSILIGSGVLNKGGAILTTSAGDKIAVFVDGSLIEVWKDVDGTPTSVDTDTATTVFGGGVFSFVHAAIDGNDDIHVVASCAGEQTRDVAYAVCDLTTGFGAWEEAYNYTEQVPANPGCAISLDSSDVPHIAIVDAVKTQGSTQDNVYYANRDGGSWGNIQQIGLKDTKTDSYNQPTLTLRNSDYVECFYYFVTDGDPAYRSYTGTWSGESVYTEISATIGFGGVTSTTGGTIYRYCMVDTFGIQESDSSVGWNTSATADRVSASLVDDSDRYIFFIDVNEDVHLVSKIGAGIWNSEGDLQVGTYYYVIAEWAYNNENQVDEISYLFGTSGAVYYDSFALAAPPVGQPAILRTQGVPTGPGARNRPGGWN